MMAAEGGEGDTTGLELLLARGAMLQIKDQAGDTALQKAAQAGNDTAAQVAQKISLTQPTRIKPKPVQ